MTDTPRLLVVTAVPAERDALLAAGLPAEQVAVVGVGVAEAAARTALLLAAAPPEVVLCAGIGGGFAPRAIGDIAVAVACVHADLGAESPEGFLPLSELGFGRNRYDVEPRLALELADRCGGHLGTVLTVSTVTGTAASAGSLAVRYPDAVAEGMEGTGVAAAAAAAGVAFAEVRAVSNAVGPRDRAAWRIPEALAALGGAIAAVAAGG